MSGIARQENTEYYIIIRDAVVHFKVITVL